ncbi:MAG: serine/threonine-protein phosphatase [Acidobacteria bacterium]|nr:serine/threonine-protein phosphatase [Acidobacteriota bacterium]
MIRQDTQSQKFLSMFLGLIDTRGRSLHYINAGHVPPLVIRARDEIITLASGGILIGLFDSPEYERGKLNLLPGDALVLCTDGIVEAADTAGEEYGSERLVELIRHNPHRTAKELVEMIHRNVEEFSRGGIQADDRVLMIIKIQERPSAFSQKYPA